MFEVRYPIRDESSGRTGLLRIAGGIWTGDVCGFEFTDTVYGLAGTANCDWREPRPRLWLDDRAPADAGAQQLMDRISALLLPFHRGAFRHLTQHDLRRCDGRVRGCTTHLTYAALPDASEWTHLLDHVARIRDLSRVLDVGCSAGEVVRLLRDRGIDAHGFDVCPDVASHAARSVAPFLRAGPLAAIPYSAADGFDTLVALDVFEHIPEHLIGAMVGEFARLGVKRIVTRIALCEFHHAGHVTLRPLSWWDRQLSPWFHRVTDATSRELAAAFDADRARYLRVYELSSVPAPV
jgi:SAM-dependent methyltransferase